MARLGLKAKVAGRPVQDVAKDMLAIAHEGLKRRNRLSAGMVDETNYLAELEDIADTGVTAGRTPAGTLPRPLAGRRVTGVRDLRLLKGLLRRDRIVDRRRPMFALRGAAA